jgi:hypothetical protein
MSLKYSKDAVTVGFVGKPDMAGGYSFNHYGQNFADAIDRTVQEQVDLVNSKANNCRGSYEPVFASDSKYLPVSNPLLNPCTGENSGATLVGGIGVIQLTEVPKKQEDGWDLLSIGVLALAVYGAYKLIA